MQKLKTAVTSARALRSKEGVTAIEYGLIAALIGARARAGLTQAQLARRMKTTQAVVARLESGRTKPSTRTLERFAAATGMRLRISFEPEAAR